MTLNSTVLFDLPQSEIASLLNQTFSEATSVKIVVGFATVEGIKVFENSVRRDAKKLETLVIGAGTYKAFEALDELIGFGVSPTNLFVHLGHTKLTNPGAKFSFYRYHPMLHSKIYYFEKDNKTACAFIGSHNITGFALMGLNGEASIMLEGDVKHPEFEKIRNHIEHAKAEAAGYESGMKEAYSWWTNQFFNGLVQKSNDIPRDTENTKTILLFCQQEEGYPISGNILYFELPQALGKVRSLRAEVHVFVFDNLPGNPFACLSSLNNATQSFWCSVEGVENDTGGKELSADWYIDGQHNPVLRRAANPFRPTARPGMQQIRVKLKNQVFNKFDYHFGIKANEWFPVLASDKKVAYDKDYAREIEKLELIPSEAVDWSLVEGLSDSDSTNNAEQTTPYYKALKSLEPESGAFILFSTARKKL